MRERVEVSGGGKQVHASLQLDVSQKVNNFFVHSPERHTACLDDVQSLSHLHFLSFPPSFLSTFFPFHLLSFPFSFHFPSFRIDVKCLPFEHLFLLSTLVSPLDISRVSLNVNSCQFITTFHHGKR